MTAYTFRSFSSDNVHLHPFSFNELCLLKFRDAINGHILGSMTVLIIILQLS